MPRRTAVLLVAGAVAVIVGVAVARHNAAEPESMTESRHFGTDLAALARVTHSPVVSLGARVAGLHLADATLTRTSGASRGESAVLVYEGRTRRSRTIVLSEFPARSGAGRHNLSLGGRSLRSSDGGITARSVGAGDAVLRHDGGVVVVSPSWTPRPGEWRRLLSAVRLTAAR